MRNNIFSLTRFWTLLLLGVVGVVLSGCVTTEPENASARPWNQPRGWETGLPPAMYEGR
jgi:hypothetical protein